MVAVRRSGEQGPRTGSDVRPWFPPRRFSLSAETIVVQPRAGLDGRFAVCSLTSGSRLVCSVAIRLLVQ